VKTIPTGLERAMAIYLESWASDDMSRWSELFTEDCDFVSWTGVWWRSRAENLTGHTSVSRAIAAQRPRYRIDIASVELLAPDIALVHATWVWPGFIPAAGVAAEDRAGILTMILVERGGQWLIRASHNTRTVGPGDR
jgi:uncharacterized protein (TIGR02246 family)